MKLTEAIDKIDLLINQLESGALVGTSTAAPAAAPPQPQLDPSKGAQKKKTKPKKEQPPATKKAAPAVEDDGSPEALFDKANFVVARVIGCTLHPNSDKLLINNLDIGNGETRQIVAGLQKYVALDEMLGSAVVVILNLKTAKLGGEVSEGMILAASTTTTTGTGSDAEEKKEHVKPIRPPQGASPGSRVGIQGRTPTASYVKTLKSDHWKKIAAGLAVKNEEATYHGVRLLVCGGSSEEVEGEGLWVVKASGFVDGATIS